MTLLDVRDVNVEVNHRKQEVNTRASELEALERRIREMENRLKANKPTPNGIATAARQPLGSKAEQASALTQAEQDVPQRTTGTSRPGTAKQQQAPAHGGDMPPTPTDSEGEYEVVDCSSHVNTPGDAGVETRSFTDLVIVSKDGDRDS
jgi:hypothetical protein